MFRSYLVRTLAVLLVVYAAHAQPTPRVDVPRADSTVSIVITATRLRFAVDSIPWSISIIDAARNLQGRSGASLDDAIRFAPGLQIDNRHNAALGERMSIRGFGARSQFGVRGVRVIADGLPLTKADGQTALDEIDPATVLQGVLVRGPSSVLYGNAAGGGLILTTIPSPNDKWGAHLGATAGSYGFRRLNAGAMIGEGNGGWFSVSDVHSDGYRDHSSSSIQHASAAGWINPGVGRLTILGRYVHLDAENPGALNDSLQEANPLSAAAANLKANTGKEATSGTLGVTWRADAGATGVVASLHGSGRNVRNPIVGRVIDIERTSGGGRLALSHNVPLQGETIVLDAGGEFQFQHDKRHNFGIDPLSPGAVLLDQVEDVTAIAGFAGINFPLGGSLRLAGSLRYDNIFFAVSDHLISDADPDDSGNRTMSDLSSSLGVTWNPLPEFGFYALAATAFETPTTTELANRPNAAGGFNPDLSPQRSISWEAGLRGSSPDVIWSVSIYHTIIDDELISFQIAGGERDYFRNVGSSIHRGLEAALEVRPISGLSLNGTWAFIDARFDFFRSEAGRFDGNRVPGVAPNRLELGAIYTTPFGLIAGTDIRYVSRVPANDANSAYANDYALLGARLFWPNIYTIGTGTTTWRVDASAGIDNVLDQPYTSAVTVNAFGGRYYEPGPGRTFSVGVRVGVDAGMFGG